MKTQAYTTQELIKLIPKLPILFQQKLLAQAKNELARLDALKEFQSEYPDDHF